MSSKKGTADMMDKDVTDARQNDIHERGQNRAGQERKIRRTPCKKKGGAANDFGLTES